MTGVVLFGIFVLSLIFMCMLTRVNLLHVFRDIIRAFNKGISNKSKEYHEDTNSQFERMTLDQKRKSKKYAYYCFVNEMIATFQFKERGITVEGFTIGIVVLWIIAGLILAVLSANVAFAILAPILGFPTTLAGMFLASRVGVRRRKQMLLDSMDILCAVMTDGILKAVKGNIQQFPEDVRHYFDSFIKNVELLNMSIPDAVRRLNHDIGGLYDEFCDSVINYEANRAAGMETLFNFYIEENAKALERDRAIKRMSDDVNMDFFASLGAIVLFAVITSYTLTGGPGLWATPIGIVVIVVIITGAVSVFTYIQYLLSKAYIYTEKE